MATPKNIKIKLKVRVETSDHTGYCSDNECEYIDKIITRTFIPRSNDCLKETGEIDWAKIESMDWGGYLGTPDVNINGSYCCTLSNECEEADLGLHEYRHTIKSVEVIVKGEPGIIRTFV